MVPMSTVLGMFCVVVMCVVEGGPRLELISVCHMRRYSDSSSVGSSRDLFFFNQLRRGRGPVCCVVRGRRAEVASSRDIDCSEGGSDVSVVSPAPRGARCSFSDGCNQCSDAKGWRLTPVRACGFCAAGLLRCCSGAGDGAWTCVHLYEVGPVVAR